jgi:hypothetical protein
MGKISSRRLSAMGFKGHVAKPPFKYPHYLYQVLP